MITKIKKENANRLKAAIDKEVKRLIAKNDIKALSKNVQGFIADCWNDANMFDFNEYGELESSATFDLPNSLEETDDDVKEALMESISDQIGCFKFERDRIIGTQACGEVVKVSTAHYDSRCYAVYSDELGLKINRSDVIGDDDSEKTQHALYLIEIAMRKSGIFPSIVEVDYQGQFVKFLSTNMGAMTDKELEAVRKKVCKIQDDEVQS